MRAAPPTTKPDGSGTRRHLCQDRRAKRGQMAEQSKAVKSLHRGKEHNAGRPKRHGNLIPLDAAPSTGRSACEMHDRLIAAAVNVGECERLEVPNSPRNVGKQQVSVLLAPGTGWVVENRKNPQKSESRSHLKLLPGRPELPVLDSRLWTLDYFSPAANWVPSRRARRSFAVSQGRDSGSGGRAPLRYGEGGRFASGCECRYRSGQIADRGPAFRAA
jgi:hypothetical protein